ncbi:DUF4097 family beta strand repeat-containing protein [Nonomuraea sp. NPDC047529]|uniref:DUF4097 family beta strand repeat-containing protein n=1 Tax=Nonomuraea sp. NPDC047529 TaxID=3155623 RepID=UPI0033E2123E
MRATGTAGGLVLAALVLTGCGLQGITKAANQEQVTYKVTEKVAGLSLVGGAGEVRVSETSGAAVRVVETHRWSAERPVAEHEVEGDTLTMSYDCSAATDNCSVDYVIEVPEGLRVEVETGSGGVDLRGLGGPLKVKVGSGDVSATGLTGREFTGQTGSGDIALTFASAPDKVGVTSGSGHAKLTLPAEPYDVETSTKSGDTNVTVTDDPGASRKIVATSGSGDIEVLRG